MPLGYPSSDGTSEEGEQIAENMTATSVDPTFAGGNLIDTAAVKVYEHSAT